MRISKQYASLPNFLANPDPPITNNNSSSIETPKRDHRSKHRLKVERRRLAKREARLEHLYEHYFLDAAIDVAEDERTTIAKENTNDLKKNTIDFEHTKRIKPTPGFIQKGINMGLSIRATIKRAMRFIKADKKRVRFTTKITTAESQYSSVTSMVTYDLGADDNYMSKADTAKENMPIL